MTRIESIEKLDNLLGAVPRRTQATLQKHREMPMEKAGIAGLRLC